jgi:nitrate reductase gamma subunit
MIFAGVCVAAAIFIAGLFGWLVSAWGYGLFLAAVALWGGSILLSIIFIFSNFLETERLKKHCRYSFFAGLWAYIYCIAAFGGFFIYEAFAGRVDLKYMLFGPAILTALGILEYGIFRALISKNRATFERYRPFISREKINKKSIRRILVDDIILQKTLYSVSFIRWLRHSLILWGFAFLVLIEMFRVFFQEALPAFGFQDIWHVPNHPVRLTFGFLYDFFGLMVIVGCLLSIGWRISVQGTDDKKFSDTPTVWFLLFVMFSGFIVEALRISGLSMDEPYVAVEFVGYALALMLASKSADLMAFYDLLWIIHVLGSCLFIAYVPMRRLIHSCATPFGRLMNSQKEMLSDKKRAILSGLFGRNGK